MKLADLLEEFNIVIDTPAGLTQLRLLILDLAISGRLTDNNDGSNLDKIILEIDENRKKLSSNGERRIKKKRKVVVREERPWGVSESWSWLRFADFILFIDYRGKTPKKVESGVRLITAKNIKNGFVQFEPKEFIRESSYDDWMTRGIPQKGDLLFTTEAPLGHIAIIDFDFKFALAQRAICFRLLHKDINPYCIMYFMLSNIFKDYLISHSTGMTAKGIKSTLMKKLPFPLPPLAEQNRIVQRIESLFAEVDELEAKLTRQTKLDEKLQRAINAEVQQAPNAEASKSAWTFITSNFETLYHTVEAIDNLKQNILNEAVRGRLVPQNPNDEPASELLKKIESEKQRLYEDGEIRKPKKLTPVKEDKIPFEIPESWEWTRLGLASINITDGFHSTPTTSDDGIPYLMATHIKDGDIDFENCLYVSEEQYHQIKNKINLKKGDLLVVNIGASSGKAVINPVDFEFCFKNVAVINKPNVIQKDYLYRYFLLNRERILDEVTQGGAQPYLSLKMLNNLEFPLPPLPEQYRIVQRIGELFAICDRFKAQLEQREKVNERLVKGLVGEFLEKASNVGKEPIQAEEDLMAAESEVEYLTKQQIAFIQILFIAHALYVLKQRNMLQGEMGLAKYVFLLDRIGGVDTRFKFEQNNFGPYPSNFKRRLFTRSKYFYKTGEEGYEVIDLTKKSDRLFEKESEHTDQVQDSMQNLTNIFKPYQKNRAHKLELLASVCWLVEKTRRTDFDTIWEELENWETPKRDDVARKSELFTKKEVKNSLNYIIENNWDKKLIK